MKARTTTLFLLWFLIVSFVCAQEEFVQKYPAYRSDDTASKEENKAKSLQATNAYSWTSCRNNATGKYSDYYLYFRWDGFNYGCDCSNGYYATYITINGIGYYAGNVYGVSYNGDDCKIGIGPGKSGTCTTRSNEGGKDDYFIFGCVSGCGHYWYTTAPIYYGTYTIYRPNNVTASQGVWDYKIKLDITPGTDIPSNMHGYIVTRSDGKFETVLPYNTTTVEDATCMPGKEYTYYVRTYTDNFGGRITSESFSVVGNTFDLNLQASSNENAAVKLNWNDVRNKGKASLTEYVVNRLDTLKNDFITLDNYLSPTTLNTLDQSILLIPGFRYMYILQPQPETGFFPDTAWGKALPNGRIKGSVISPSGYPVENVLVCAVRKTPVPQDTTTRYCAVTDSSGNYNISKVYYYESAEFTLTPYKETHGFAPASASVLLNSDYPMINQGPFRDTSAFVVSGKVIQIMDGDTCPVKNVMMYLDNNAQFEVKTNDYGEYQLNVGQMGSYTVKPALEKHGFIPDTMRIYVKSDTCIQTFVDTTMFTLSGYVKAACDTYIGKARLRITSGEYPLYYIDKSIITDSLTGYYEIKLPARDYRIYVEEFYPEHDSAPNGKVLAYFDTIALDLTFENKSLDFIFRSAPELEIAGFTDVGCGDYADVPLVEQGYKYTIDLLLKDAFAGNTCPSQSGMVIIQNRLGKEDLHIDSLIISDGKASYSFVPGNPNLIAPYLKDISFTACLEKETVYKPVDVLVEGNFARENTFTTVSPEIPFMIMRDPPGDASYSYLEKGTTTETAMSFSSAVEGSLNLWAEVKLGTKFELGLFGNSVETEIWGKVRGSLEVGASIKGQNEYQLTLTNAEIFKTSENSDITGEGGDLFAGSALNMIYALTDIVKYDPGTCSVKKTVGLCVGVEDFATTFMYTEDYIQNTLIPGLQYLKKYYEDLENDSSTFYANQIKVWEQTLALNKHQKDRSKFIKNISFSSGVSYENSQEVSVTESSSMEFNLFIASEIAAEAGIEIAGSGISGGVAAKFRVDMGSSVTSSSSSSKKTGFVLSDDDAGDAFTVDICSDNVFGTPVFKVVSGQSSCPWEPGTQPREGVQLISDDYNQYVEDPTGLALFHLQLGNLSQSNELRVYNLVFDQSSNPDGAIITLGGSQVQGGIPTPYSIAAGGSKQATVTVEKGPEAFDYNNLQFTLYSMCDDGQIRDTVLLSAHFTSSCSAIRISYPKQGWVLTGSDGNNLNLTLKGYDKSLLNFVKIQLALKGSNNWQNIDYLTPDDLDDESTEIDILLDQFKDGNYELRALLECSTGKVYSDVIQGRIDRTPPQLYGIPEPSDLSLDSSDLIMAVFDEPVNAFKLSSSNVLVKNIATGQTISSTLGCNNNTILIIPEMDGDDITGDTLNVTLTGVEDLYGNVITQPVTWSFVVNTNPVINEDEDTDQDGITNALDNCPYTSNPDQADMDADAIGDVCDPDVDGDDVPNITDNCMFNANPGQEDSNENGIGDECDKSSGVNNPDGMEGYYFEGNYPNPFSQQTAIKYAIPVASKVIIRIYDILGNELMVLVNKDQKPGEYEVKWDATGCSEGIYLCKFYVESNVNKSVFMKTAKMIVSK